MTSGENPPLPPPDAARAGGDEAAERERRLIQAALAQAGGVSPGASAARHEAHLPPHDTFPGYELVREIHRGGQGTVYLAIQLATKRRVAIKVMHAGAATGSSGRARFEREVQILGQLHHPNIVKIYDSGVASDGSFFYVMDYISGRSLDEEISRTGTSDRRSQRRSPTDAGTQEPRPIRDVLALFAKICEAISAAHMRGVIHRDLKPANIRIDPAGEPVVVDFGLAKIALSDVAEGVQGQSPRLMSMTGQFIGSMPWASPEQAEGRPESIDVRTDVYSLGVILYQLLTGRFPYPVIGNMRDVLDNIMRAEPARPSTARKQINDEVETIILKCLSKEKERRYQSAGELARDIHRYLRGEPIEAKRDSGWYVVTKTLRRHKGLVAGLAAGALLITGFSIAMSVLYARARTAEAEALTNATLAGDEAARAKSEAIKAVQIQDFLVNMLGEVAPIRAQGSDPTVRDVLDAASTRLETNLATQPIVLAAIQDLVGTLYFELGRSDRSEQYFRSALSLRQRHLAPGDPDVVRSTVALAWLHRNERKYDEAESLLKRALEAAKAPGFPPEVSATARLQLARVYDQIPARRAEAEALFRSAISLAAPLADRDAQRTAGLARWHLGKLLVILKRPDEARPLFDEAAHGFEGQGDRLTRAKVMLDVALLERDRKDFESAVATCRGAIEVMGQVFAQAPGHPDLLAARSKLAAIHFAAADFEPAAREFREIYELASKAPQAQNRAQSWIYRASLGSCLIELGRYEEAEKELLATYHHFATTSDFPDERARSIGRLEKLYDRWGKPEESAKYKALRPSDPK